MFTGIVQGTAPVVSIDEKANFRTHVVQLPPELLPGLVPGASVANNGCCLTVTSVEGDRVSFDLMKETLRLTNLGILTRAISSTWSGRRNMATRSAGILCPVILSVRRKW